MHCHATGGQVAWELLQCTATPPGGSGQWNSYNTLPNYLGAVGAATLAMHCHAAWGHGALELVQCTATLPGGNAVEFLQGSGTLLGGSGQRKTCNTLPHCVRVVGSGTPAMQCLTAYGQWVVEPLQCTTTLRGANNGGTLTMHCLTAWGQ